MSVDELKELQLKIIKTSKVVRWVFIFIFGIVYIFTVASVPLSDSDGAFYIYSFFFEFLFIYVFCAFIKILLTGNDIERFKKDFKNIFVLSALNKNFDNVIYDPDGCLEKSVIEKTEMMSTGDQFSSNDLILGSYKGINFIQADVHIEEKELEKDSNGHMRVEWVTLFLGRWMVFDFNKNFKANIRVASSYFNDIMPLLDKKYVKVKLEDTEFNKMFSVRAQSEYEAFYILTPHFMEKLKNVKNQLKCGIMFCFVDNKLHVAISNDKDSFEPNVYKLIDEDEIEEAIMKDVRVIMGLVDELNLDNSLFKVEE